MICADVNRDLDAYVDRELDAEAAAAIRQHLDGCARCRERVTERQALSRLVQSTGYRTAPDRLRARVAASAARSTSSHRLMMWAAAAVLALAVGGGAVLVRSPQVHGDPIADEVVNGHVRSLMAEHLFDVRSTDQHTVKPWFLGKLDFAPPVADLASIGFPLVGGRLDYVGGRPAAALVYQRQKHTINVFVSPDETSQSTPIASQSIRGFHVRHWTRGGMAFWAVSDLNDNELTAFARALAGL
ncbi:MAG TPA: anti-sigma factor [Vicinamibacterales bacterium]|nr:anti-sigma factor [Vicinamibacterales bacterium]